MHSANVFQQIFPHSGKSASDLLNDISLQEMEFAAINWKLKLERQSVAKQLQQHDLIEENLFRSIKNSYECFDSSIHQHELSTSFSGRSTVYSHPFPLNSQPIAKLLGINCNSCADPYNPCASHHRSSKGPMRVDEMGHCFGWNQPLNDAVSLHKMSSVSNSSNAFLRGKCEPEYAKGVSTDSLLDGRRELLCGVTHGNGRVSSSISCANLQRKAVLANRSVNELTHAKERQFSSSQRELSSRSAEIDCHGGRPHISSFNIQVDPLQDGRNWRNPRLHEVIAYLSSSHYDAATRSAAAAHLQHLSYRNDSIKSRTRLLGGLSPLVEMLQNDRHTHCQLSALGALRNLCFGVQQLENKREVCRLGALTCLTHLLSESTDKQVLDLVSALLWNLSSDDDIKSLLLLSELPTLLTKVVILPHAGLQLRNGVLVYINQMACMNAIFRNATGVLRNVSGCPTFSSGDFTARRRLRECAGLVDALFHMVRSCIINGDVDSKSMENCVCTLRNLSYACQEVVDVNYLRKSSQKKSSMVTVHYPSNDVNVSSHGVDLLWQCDVVSVYLTLIFKCVNLDTLEAALGALLNLTACQWPPAVAIRSAVRKEKGLPLIVELLASESLNVVCTAAETLRNLAQDRRNQELLARCGMMQLIKKLPLTDSCESPTPLTDKDEALISRSIRAVLTILLILVRNDAQCAVSFGDLGGIPRVLHLTRLKKFDGKVACYAHALLLELHKNKSIKSRLREHGWRRASWSSKWTCCRARKELKKKAQMECSTASVLLGQSAVATVPLGQSAMATVRLGQSTMATHSTEELYSQVDKLKKYRQTHNTSQQLDTRDSWV